MPRCRIICSKGIAKPVLIGRYTGMEVIKWVMHLDSVIPNSRIGRSTFSQRTGSRKHAMEKITARNGLRQEAEIPSTIPVRSTTPSTPPRWMA